MCVIFYTGNRNKTCTVSHYKYVCYEKSTVPDSYYYYLNSMKKSCAEQNISKDLMSIPPPPPPHKRAHHLTKCDNIIETTI